MIRKVISLTPDIKKTIDGNLAASPDSNAGSGLSHCIISIKFIDKSNLNARLDIFDTLKTLGTFNIQDLREHVYILDFKSKSTKDEMVERLKELAGPDRLFDYTIGEVVRVWPSDGHKP